MTAWKEERDGVTIVVKVVPRASRTEIAGMEGEAIRIRLNAPPVEGRANEALIRFFADVFHIARSSVEILNGQTARRKRIRLRGVRANQIVEQLKLE